MTATLSAIIPLYNEDANVKELVPRALAALNSVSSSFEILFIDDGSTDHTVIELMHFRKSEPRIKIVQLSKNFGHQSAYTAGLTLSEGKYIVMLDGDLQDPPELIAKMYAKMQSDPSLQVVYAKRKSKKESRSRNSMMRIFHGLFSIVLEKKSMEDVGNFSIFTQEIKDAMLLYSEKIRYLPGIRFHVGFNQAYVEYDRDERFAGKAKMNLSKLVSLGLDALFGFSVIPIRIMLFLGFFGLLLCILGVIYVFVSKMIGIAPYGWSSNLFFIFVFSSLQITFLGILGEYIHRIYREVQNRPLFIVKNVIR